jgi:hypothetical protein
LGSGKRFEMKRVILVAVLVAGIVLSALLGPGSGQVFGCHAPTVATVGADAGTDTATLHGNLIDWGVLGSQVCYVAFEWGATTSYGQNTTAQPMQANGAFTDDLSGLLPGTEYHFRAKAWSAYGSDYGVDMCFTTEEAQAHPPEITSSPVTTATQDVLYEYQVTATDPDGDVLAYSLDVSPSGMTIGADTGLVQWTPTASQIGNHTVTVRVEDPTLLFDTQTFALEVLSAGNPPEITSSPVTTATQDVLYEYQVTATDPDGDVLAYSLDVSPSGMTIGADTGLVQWTPTVDQIGYHTVTVRVEDPTLLFDTQTFMLEVLVAGDEHTPQIISEAIVRADVGVPYIYDVEAMDPDGDVLVYSLDSAPADMTIQSDTGLVEWTPSDSHIGNVTTVVVRVTDPTARFDLQAFTMDVRVATILDSTVVLRVTEQFASETPGVSRIRLEWIYTCDIQHRMIIERSSAYSGPFEEIADFEPVLHYHRDNDIVWKTYYYYRAKIYNASGESPYSSVVIAICTPSSCFIATAAYGTPLAQELDVLRDFRDAYLLTNPVGEALVESYYSVSPPIADFIRESPGLRAVIRACLAPVVAATSVMVVTTFIHKMLLLGSSLLLLLALTVSVIRRRQGSRYPRVPGTQ